MICSGGVEREFEGGRSWKKGTGRFYNDCGGCQGTMPCNQSCVYKPMYSRSSMLCRTLCRGIFDFIDAEETSVGMLSDSTGIRFIGIRSMENGTGDLLHRLFPAEWDKMWAPPSGTAPAVLWGDYRNNPSIQLCSIPW
ncbi:Uncharacterized protein HZ326_28862 [Fusarium oxysporum f. sp. albedinis]|nr:Uncharacterized protein HZ326_28862 [Fusarium oxysporum f. sp. albedinis]